MHISHRCLLPLLKTEFLRFSKTEFFFIARFLPLSKTEFFFITRFLPLSKTEFFLENRVFSSKLGFSPKTRAACHLTPQKLFRRPHRPPQIELSTVLSAPFCAP